MHIYEATTGKPVAIILRPGRTPGGAEVALVLRHVVKAIRARWPRVDILVRADSGFPRDELMAWCEANGVDYLFGLARNQRLVAAIADELAHVWTPPALQAGFFFAQACVVGCCYVSGLLSPMPSGLDEIRELALDYKASSELFGSLGLCQPRSDRHVIASKITLAARGSRER